jgi:hypothetical protein
MTVKFDLTPETEAGLTALARAQGLSLEAYVAKILRERSAPSAGPAAADGAKVNAFVAWAREHRAVGSLTDESIGRKNLVRDAR